MPHQDMKLALLLGAGATVSDVETRPFKERPPLDKGFFRVAKSDHPSLTGDVSSYMLKIYECDIFQPEEDSLEKVMGQIYTDTFNRSLKTAASAAFRSLLSLFNRRLATTTNNIRPTNKRWLYRILADHLGQGVDPKNITIITFNQDLQVEKALCAMSEVARWRRLNPQLFNFPGCYGLGERTVTSPNNSASDLFQIHAPRNDCLRVFKLHGSLNWYSTHTSSEPSQSAMFRPKRKIKITRRRIISADMRVSGKRTTHALPIVVPPVTHKSAVLPEEMKGVWSSAESALKEADELVIFGYSCPALDFESANLLRRSQRHHKSRISVIDPDGRIAARYIELLRPDALSYFVSAKAYLARPESPD
jgi:hypothetical protein